jgi:hypothetical protein
MKIELTSRARRAAMTFIALLWVGAGPPSVRAATILWTNSAGGVWSAPQNWSPNQVPSGGDSAYLTNAGTYTVMLDVSPTIAGLLLGGENGEQHLVLSNRTLNVTNAGLVQKQGVFDFLGGTLAGQLAVANGAQMNLAGTAGKYLDGVLTNAGLLRWTNSGLFQLDEHVSRLVILPGGLFDIQSDQYLGHYGNAFITNAGTIRKSAGVATNRIDSPLHSSGRLETLAGGLRLAGGGTLAGPCDTGAGTAIELTAGVFTFTPDYQSSGPGFVGVPSGKLTLQGVLAGALGWSGGEVLGALTVATNGLLAVSGSATKYLDGVITNWGTIRWTGPGVFRLYDNPARVVNEPGGLFDIQTDQSFQTWGTALVTNAGTVRKSASGGLCDLDPPFHNTGRVEVQSGQLRFDGGGTLAGSCDAAANTILGLAGGVFTLTPGFQSSGAGFVGVTNAYLTLNGTLASALGWSSGEVFGALTVTTNGLLTLSGSAIKYLDGVITNLGTIRWTGPGIFRLYDSAARMVNQPGGLFDIQTDQSLQTYGTALITNAGTFRKSAGNGLCDVDPPFHNTGRVEAQTGTIRFDGSGTLAGVYEAGSGAVVNFSGGPFTLESAYASTGPGFVGVASGTPTITGTLNSVLGFTNGEVYGVITVTPAGLLDIGGTSTKYLGVSLTNSGTVRWGGAGALNLYGATTRFVNQPGGVFDIQTDRNLGHYSGALILNAGLIRKSAGTNLSLINGTPVINSGTVQALSGRLSFAGGFTNNGGGFAVRLNNSNEWGRLVFANALTLNGPFSVAVLPSYTPAVSNVFPVISFPSVTGSFTSYSGLDLGNGLTLTPRLDPTAFSLTVEGTLLPPTPNIVVTPLTLDFGNVAVGSSSNRSLALGNTGTATLIVNDLSAGGAFTFTAPPRPFNVATGAQQIVTVTFAPTVPGTNALVARISSNDPDEGAKGISLSGVGVPVTEPGLRADYRFQGNLQSSVGNPPALASLGGSFVAATVDGTTRTVFAFGPNGGALLQPGASVVPSNVFSIVLLAALDEVSGYRRLLGFETNAAEAGFYVHNGRLTHWPVMDGASRAVAGGAFAQIVLTRAADGWVRGYVNGNRQFEYADPTGSVGPGASGLLRFFRDDGAEASAGQVARLRIYDVALTSAQVAALDRLSTLGMRGPTPRIKGGEPGPPRSSK